MKISLCFCGKNLALVFPTFPSGKQFSAMHGTNGILNFSADTDTVYSFALRNHAWRGKLKKVISVQYYLSDCLLTWHFFKNWNEYYFPMKTHPELWIRS